MHLFQAKALAVGLIGATVWAVGHTGLVLTREELGYFASQAFEQTLRRYDPQLVGCADATFKILEIGVMQDLDFDGAPQPRGGLWRVKYDVEGCGSYALNERVFRGRIDAPPELADTR